MASHLSLAARDLPEPRLLVPVFLIEIIRLPAAPKWLQTDLDSNSSSTTWKTPLGFSIRTEVQSPFLILWLPATSIVTAPQILFFFSTTKFMNPSTSGAGFCQLLGCDLRERSLSCEAIPSQASVEKEPCPLIFILQC